MPDFQYGSALRRRFNVPAGPASTYPARQLLPLEDWEVEVGGDSQSGGRTPRVRIRVWLFCNDAELEKNQQIIACYA